MEVVERRLPCLWYNINWCYVELSGSSHFAFCPFKPCMFSLCRERASERASEYSECITRPVDLSVL